MAYPTALVDALVAELGLDGHGRLLDVGCEPGSLTLLLAPHVQRATGVDAHADVLAEAARQAAAVGISNVDRVHARAEELPAAELGPFRVGTSARSLHWTDRRRVAELLHGALASDGALVHVHVDDARGRRRRSFAGPTRLEVAGPVVARDANDVLASVFSLSFAAPHLFGGSARSRRHCAGCCTRPAPTGASAGRCPPVADVWRP